MKKSLLLLLLVASFAGVIAQEPTPTPGQRRRDVWQADLPGGKYFVRLSAVSAISMHQYIVDGTARVTEVNIDTIGSELVRFYFIEPNTPQTPNGIGQSAIDLIKDKAGVARRMLPRPKNFTTRMLRTSGFLTCPFLVKLLKE